MPERTGIELGCFVQDRIKEKLITVEEECTIVKTILDKTHEKTQREKKEQEDFTKRTKDEMVYLKVSLLVLLRSGARRSGAMQAPGQCIKAISNPQSPATDA